MAWREEKTALQKAAAVVYASPLFPKPAESPKADAAADHSNLKKISLFAILWSVEEKLNLFV